MPSLKWVDDNTCKALVEKCLKEDWELLDYRKREKYWALKRYLRETFNRLAFEENQLRYDGGRRKLPIDEESGLAVMDTGIADPHYRSIYALLERVEDQEYVITAFFVDHGADNSAARQKAHKVFGSNLPLRARYCGWGESAFNVWWQWEPAYPHIIYYRLYRFPATYIEKAVNSPETRASLMDALARAKSADDEGRLKERTRVMDDDVRPLLDQGDKALYKKFYNDLSKAIQVAKRRATFNWGVAMLGYYPNERKVQYYLPICLEYEEQPDFALVLGAQKRSQGENYFYAARTILPLDDAYADARLVMRPVENWIDAAVADVRQSNNERFLAPRTSVAPDFSSRDARARLLHDGRYENINSGDVIGVKRGADDRYNPDIVLDAHYRFVSNKHGEFACRDGLWTFTSFGRNGTILRRGGDDYTLEKGIPFELQNDDELFLGGHGGSEGTANGLGGGTESESRGFVFVALS